MKIKSNNARKPKAASLKQQTQNSPLRVVESNVPRSSVPRPHPAMVSQVCGLVDPFCEHARGAKYPDDSSIRTLPFTFRTTQTLTTNASGSVCAILWPRISSDGSGVYNPATTVGTTVTPATNFAAATVAALSGFTSYRIVSCGFRVRRISPLLTTSGMVFTRSHAIDLGSEMGVFQGNTYSASQSNDTALADASDLCFIFEHTSQMPQTFYNPQDTVFATAIPSGFNPATVFVTGAPATTNVAELEFIMHVEYVFSPVAPLALATTPSPPSSALVTAAASAATSAGSTFFHDAIEIVGKAVREKALSYLSSALSRSNDPRLRIAGSAAAYLVD